MHEPAESVARWLGEQTGGPPASFEQVPPGDEQVFPDREQRDLDSLPSRLVES